MALNNRQVAFMTRLQAAAKMLEDLHGECHALKESYDEEFAVGQDNDLSTGTDLVDRFFVDSVDVATCINQPIDKFINFWTGVAVGTREYGKDVRRVR